MIAACKDHYKNYHSKRLWCSRFWFISQYNYNQTLDVWAAIHSSLKTKKQGFPILHSFLFFFCCCYLVGCCFLQLFSLGFFLLDSAGRKCLAWWSFYCLLLAEFPLQLKITLSGLRWTYDSMVFFMSSASKKPS